MTLPLRTPVSLRHRLGAAGILIRQSQMVQPGRIDWWNGRKRLFAEDLAILKTRTLFPKDADTVRLCAEDYAVVMREG